MAYSVKKWSTYRQIKRFSFAIRKENWKLIMCPGSGGWSFPKPDNKDVIDSLPKYQLYNLDLDPEETQNQYNSNYKNFEELKSLLIRYITQGRSTPGLPQNNDAIDFEWQQAEFALQVNQ